MDIFYSLEFINQHLPACPVKHEFFEPCIAKKSRIELLKVFLTRGELRDD
jgi:hypothetical protein